MGILDQYPELALSESDKNDALNMGLLQAGLGILANNTSRNAMPAIAKGGMMGLQGYQQSIDRAQAKKLEELKLRDIMEKFKQQKTLEELQQRIASGNMTTEEATRALMSAPGMIGPALQMLSSREEKQAARDFRAQEAEATRTYREAEAEKNRVFQAAQDERMARLTASLRAPTAPTMTEVIDPANPNRMLRVDAKTYGGGTLGSQGVLGVSGKEPSFAAKEGKLNQGKEQLSVTLDSLKEAYDTLDKSRDIPSTERNPLSNIASYVSGTGMGQATERMLGTKSQTQRDIINSSRMILLNDIKQATGMSAQQMNSNVELQNWLRALGDPNVGYQAATSIIENIRAKYVDGKSTGRESEGKIGSKNNVGQIPTEGYSEIKTINDKRYGKRGDQWFPL